MNGWKARTALIRVQLRGATRMPQQIIHVQGETRGAARPSSSCAENAYRITPTTEPMSAYTIAQLVLATGRCITDVVEHVDAGTWVCPQFGVLCTHVATAA